MKKIHPLIFRFGDIKSEILDNKSISSLENTILTIFKRENFIWGSEPDSEFIFKTTPFYKQWAQEEPNRIALFFENWSREYNKIHDKDVVFLIDLRGIDRDQQIYHLSNIFMELFDNEEINTLRVVLILDRYPLKEDILYKNIFILLESGKLSIQTIEDNAIDPEFLKLKIKGKLIRRIGHFQSKSNLNYCKRYFYDGRYCEKEIVSLILNYININITSKEQFEYILHISDESSWLKTSMSALSGLMEEDYKEQFVSFHGAFNVDKIPEIAKSYNGGEVLIVADFINSTQTVKKTIVELNEHFTAIKKDNIHIVSILNNSRKNIDSSENKTREITIGNIKYSIYYFIDVELQENPKELCPLCKFKIGYSDIKDDAYLKLLSYDFWDLADKYGYEYEIVKPDPKIRERKFVPIFKNWVEENAAYLAYRFNLFIDSNKINTNLNFVIVYPDETKILDEKVDNNLKSASNILSEKINEIFGYSIIGIPRYIIDKISLNNTLIDCIDLIFDKWKIDIENIAPKTDIILIDEFYKEGSTFNSIISILDHLSKPIKCYFAIADFYPEKGNIRKENHKIDFYNLYEFNYK